MLARHYNIVCFVMAQFSTDYNYKLPQMQCLDKDTHKINPTCLDAGPSSRVQLVVQAASMYAVNCICLS